LNARTCASQSMNRASFANVTLPFGPPTKKLGAYKAASARILAHREHRVPRQELLDRHCTILAAVRTPMT
jgi:hypothetical protein